MYASKVKYQFEERRPDTIMMVTEKDKDIGYGHSTSCCSEHTTAQSDGPHSEVYSYRPLPLLGSESQRITTYRVTPSEMGET